MIFIIELLSSKRDNVVYDTILVIVDKCTKIIKYLSMIIKIDVVKLTEIFSRKLFDVSIYQRILLMIKYFLISALLSDKN